MEDFDTRLWKFMHSNELQMWAHNFYMCGITYRDFSRMMFEHRVHARKFGIFWSKELWKNVCKSEYYLYIKERCEQSD